MTVTTIKVTSEVRDQLNAIAQQRGWTANSVVEMLLEEYIWSERMKTVREQMANASEEDMRTYREELAAWDVTLMDGLEGS